MYECSLNRWQAAACFLTSAAALLSLTYLALSVARPCDRRQGSTLEPVAGGQKWLLFSDFPLAGKGRDKTTMSFNESSGDQFGVVASSDLVQEMSLRQQQQQQQSRKRRSLSEGGEEARETAQRRKRKRRLSRLERKPILNEFSFPANLVQGMRFVLMCQVLDGDLPVQIKWFKDERELAPSSLAGDPLQQRLSGDHKDQLGQPDQLELMLNDELGSSLLFRRVQQHHSGNYTCLATNQFGSASYSSTMSVKVPPKWKVEPQDQHSIMGEQITIDCQAIGNPNPFIRWKFAAGTGLTLQQGAPQFHPDPQISVASQAANFKLINSNHHVQTLENGSLTIRQANKEHEGLYLCEADNGVEPSLVKVLRLIIQVQAHFVDDLQAFDSSHRPLASVATPVPASMVNSQQQQQRQLGVESSAAAKSVRVAQNSSQLRLLCQPLGDFPLTVDWLKDGQLIYTHTTAMENSAVAPIQQQQVVASPAFGQQPGARYHVSTRRSNTRSTVGGLESELLITSVRRQDAGSLTCLARNAHGQAERKLKLLVQEPPEAPEVVDVARIGSRSIGLRWLAPFDGNSPIQKYVVEFRRQTATESNLDQQGDYIGQSEKIMPPKAESSLAQVAGAGAALEPALSQQAPQQQQVQHTVHELEPLTRYSMRVFAINALGKSRPSVALSLRTEEEVPSVVPSLVEAIALSSKSIKLRWTITYPPEQEIIDGFFVGYRSLDPPQSPGSATNSLAPSKQLAALGNEQPTFTYKTIRLTNHQRPSSSSAAADLDQQRLQSEQSAYLSPVSSITKSLAASQGPSPLGGNVVQPHHSTVVVSAFEYVIGGLDRDTEYTITIQCFNKKGAGPTSDPAVFRTFSSDPPEKLALIADDISESSVHLSWRFLLGSQDQHSPMKQPTASAQPDGFVLTFAKLGVNKQLGGVKQGEHRVATSARHLVPEQLSIHQPNRSSLGPPAPSVDQWQAVQLAPQQRTHQLRSLDCGTSYAMKIWAFNKVGQGEPSELLVVSTRGKAPVAPDRRSFLSINSTQVRLHLSAWYDGGCEIDKFQVQYRIFGQHEWLLVSSNIPRDQTTLVIRDLTPATSYELLISAQNQVGPTETRYRFATLDSDGRQVPFAGRSGTESFFFLSGGSSLDNDGNPESDDYMDSSDGTTTRRFGDPMDRNTTFRWFALFKRLLNSPTALGVSLLLFVTLLALLLAYKFNTKLSTGSNSTLASSASLQKPNGSRGNTCDQQTSSNEPLMMMGCSSRDPHLLLSGDCSTEAAMSLVGNGSSSLTDSPATRPPQSHYGGAQQECHYAFPSHQVESRVPMEVYGRVDCNSGQHNTYGNCNSFVPSTTYGRADHNSTQQQQQCLVQMLMMESQQQQQQRLLGIVNEEGAQQVDAINQGPSYSSSVAALTTLARNPMKTARPNSFGYSTAGSATLGRNGFSDFQQRNQHAVASLISKPGEA